MTIRENPAGKGGASNIHHRHGDTDDVLHNSNTRTPLQSRNVTLLQAIERLAAQPGTADIRHGLAALLERPGAGK